MYGKPLGLQSNKSI